MNRLGVIVAMAVECRSLTSKSIPEGGYLSLDDGCLIGLSGAGPKAAERSANLLARAGATALVSWGCAAALAPGLNPGHLILPARIIGADGSQMETEKAWRERLAAKLIGLMPLDQGALLESKSIVAGTPEKQSLFATTGAVALDMESAGAARTAQNLKLPFLAIRSIVDPVDVTIPPSVVAAFDENGLLHVPKMLGSALSRPIDVIGVIRLGRHFGVALKTLRQVAALTREINFAAL